MNATPSNPAMAESEHAELARALEVGALPVAALAMPRQVIERPATATTGWWHQILGAARPARG